MGGRDNRQGEGKPRPHPCSTLRLLPHSPKAGGGSAQAGGLELGRPAAGSGEMVFGPASGAGGPWLSSAPPATMEGKSGRRGGASLPEGGFMCCPYIHG